MNRQAAIGVVLLLVLVALAAWLASYFIGIFSLTNPSVQAAIVAGTVGLGTVLLTVWRERSKAVREAHREKKIEIYSALHETWFSFMDKSRIDKTQDGSDPDLVEKLRVSSRQIIFYGSPKVVKTLSAFTHRSTDDAKSTIDAIRPFGRVLLAMREDIGLSNFGLDEISVQQLLISDNLSKPGKATT